MNIKKSGFLILIVISFFISLFIVNAQEIYNQTYKIEWEMLFSGIASIGVIITIIVLIFEFRKKSKVDSANIAITLISQMSKNYRETIYQIAQQIKGTPQQFSESDISNLLDELESLAFFVKEGVITKQTAYEHSVNLVNRIFKIEYIVNKIDQAKDNDVGGWTNLIWLKEEFDKMKN